MHVRVARGEPSDTAQRVAEVEVAVAVAVVGAVDEIVAVLDEVEALLRLHPGIVVLGEQGTDKRPVRGPVHVEPEIVLRTVEHLHEDIFPVRRPGHTRQIALLVEVVNLEGREDVPGGVADAD